MGGSIVSVKDADATLAQLNPAMLNQLMNTSISINQNFIFADINHGSLSYAWKSKRLQSTIHAGLSYVDYGSFLGADNLGNRTNDFNAREIALMIGAARQINERIAVGANIRIINSTLEAYSSLGLAADLGVNYAKPNSNSQLSLVIRNLGLPISHYTDQKARLPLNVLLGYSQRLVHMPFRFSVTMHHLNQWNLRIERPNDLDPINIFNEPAQESSALSLGIDNFFRHFIFSGEFLIGAGDKYALRFGYNHLRKKELAVSQFRSLGGFSFGIGLMVKKFRIDYGVGHYHLAGAVNHIGISTKISSFRNAL